MSTFSEARNAIQIRFLTAFGSVPTALDNQTFTPPVPGAGVRWVRLGVRFTEGVQDSFGAIGTRKFLKLGLLSIQVFTPIDSATDVNDALCQQVQDLYEGVRIDDIWFINGGIRYSGSDGDWYQQNVVFTIIFEDVK